MLSIHLNGGGEGDPRTTDRTCSPLSFALAINHCFTGLSCRSCLSSFAVYLYNPAQMLGHVLGQSKQGHVARNQPAECTSGGDDHRAGAPRRRRWLVPFDFAERGTAVGLSIS